jgi:hypothetical protein
MRGSASEVAEEGRGGDELEVREGVDVIALGRKNSDSLTMRGEFLHSPIGANWKADNCTQTPVFYGQQGVHMSVDR